MAPIPLPTLSDLLPRSAAIPSDNRILDSRQALARLAHRALTALTRITTTPSTPQQSHPNLFKRQGGIAIPTVYAGLNSGPSPGVVVGIVLGSIAGFLLIIWLFYALSNGRTFVRSNDYDVETVSNAPPARRTRSTRSRRTEMAQSSPRTRDRVIRQERIVRDFPRSQSRGGARESVLVDERIPERRVEGDDTIEVIEEHSSVAPAPRRKSRRGPSGGYRSVDPDLYAGGAYPQYPVR